MEEDGGVFEYTVPLHCQPIHSLGSTAAAQPCWAAIASLRLYAHTSLSDTRQYTHGRQVPYIYAVKP